MSPVAHLVPDAFEIRRLDRPGDRELNGGELLTKFAEVPRAPEAINGRGTDGACPGKLDRPTDRPRHAGLLQEAR